MTAWLVTGAGGQLGHHLVAALAAGGHDVVALTRGDLDICDPAAVEATVQQHRPDVVVNAAAYTAVDAAETDEASAFAVNETGPANLARALAGSGSRLVHVSTDYVFGGDQHDSPYEPDDRTDPHTVYGRSKLAGETAVLDLLPDASYVVRTAWVYGGPGANFVDTMRRLAAERDTVSVVDDQIGSPTWAGDLAAGLVELGTSAADPGVVHYANSGQTSWCGLAREVFIRLGLDPSRVQPVTSDAFVRPAPRPAWSVLSTRAWIERGLSRPRDWQVALAEAMGCG